MDYFYKIPNELLNQILWEYWYDMYKTKVVISINNFKENFETINMFLHKNFLPNKQKDLHYVSFYKKMNTFLLSVSMEKGLILLSKKLFPITKYLFDKKNECFKWNNNLEMIAKYCILIGNPCDRWKTYYRFSKLK
tara:strand:+ start:4224 stop:4631 length:408 start_codon:yes stop_codon:yes gene_type:complete